MNGEESFKILNIVKAFSDRPDDISFDTELLESSLIDSLNVLQIIVQLENVFQIRIGTMDVTFEDFSSCETIAKALKRLSKIE